MAPAFLFVLYLLHDFLRQFFLNSGEETHMQERFGALHILINNIERGGMPVVHGSYDLEVNRDQWDLEMDITLKGHRL